ncbi:DUF2264 domain-containing protein [Granulicella sp. dw_53]|uniref:DUF2264 domain-containing protein n=1 Tax=Granulicella sp. dw_53 TaxID=2719792 RepID=UPI001BD1F347|nr:DUF2264 domain-containing protein [Granulicella sp. dw_53]
MADHGRSDRRTFLLGSAALGAAAILPMPALAVDAGAAGVGTRAEWLKHLQRVSDPVLKALSRRELRKVMPVEAAPGLREVRSVGSPLEALGRLLAGIAPWLELEPSAGEPSEETALRKQYREWARTGIVSSVDPASPDYMRYGESAQTLVDSSFLALALLRAPKQLLHPLDAKTKQRLADALVKERGVTPNHNNWLLFVTMNEALLKVMGEAGYTDHAWDKLRVDFGLSEHHDWYLGDGVYGDGPHFHADFYNSFVIQPYLLQLMDTVGDAHPSWAADRRAITLRASRYAAIQERMIASDGSYPVLGRSITYRCGAFHHLADVARRHLLPDGVSPAQVRGALTAVMQRTLGAPGTYSADGWLQIGLAGHQPLLGEEYISTGSLYLCSFAWLPLGLPVSDPFWSLPSEPWTSQKVWSGVNLHADHAQDD